MSSLPASTSQSRPVNGRFSRVHKWPVLGVARGLINLSKFDWCGVGPTTQSLTSWSGRAVFLSFSIQRINRPPACTYLSGCTTCLVLLVHGGVYAVVFPANGGVYAVVRGFGVVAFMRGKLPKTRRFWGKLPSVALSGPRSHLPESAASHGVSSTRCRAFFGPSRAPVRAASERARAQIQVSS